MDGRTFLVKLEDGIRRKIVLSLEKQRAHLSTYEINCLVEDKMAQIAYRLVDEAFRGE